MKGKVLVLGLGNILMRDEGLGVRAVERLREEYVLPERVQALDGGVRGLALLPYLEEISRLLIIDALKQEGKAPGSLIRLEGEEIPSFLSLKISPHQEGLTDLLAVARLTGICPPEVVLWGMVPACLEVGLELSPPVEARMGELVEEVVEELRRWGLDVRRRDKVDTD